MPKLNHYMNFQQAPLQVLVVLKKHQWSKRRRGKTNKTAKGNAFEMVKPGETKLLLDINGPGMIQIINRGC
jgi:hypothetical protein